MNSLNVKNIFLLNFSFEWILRFMLWFLRQLIQSFAMKRFLHDRIRHEKTSWRWRLSFTTVNVFFHARNLAFLMRDMLVFALLIVKSITSIDSKFESSSCEILSEIHRKRSSFMNEKCCKQWLMNAKVSRKQDENETLNNLRLKRLLSFLVLAQAFSVIHSSTLFF
jgi:hypothetical protein